MLQILASPPAIVKPADAEPTPIDAALLVAWLADRSAEVPADDLIDEPWPLTDAEADRLADEAESYAMYEAGLATW